MFLHNHASKTNPSWLEFILHPFGVGTSHGRPWTHLTHHDPRSGEATTFPHIVFFALLRGSHIQMALFLETPQGGVPKLSRVGLPGLWELISLGSNLRLE
jgi:hypothetical protein